MNRLFRLNFLEEHWAVRHGFSLIVTLAATLLNLRFHALMERTPFLLYFPAIFIIAGVAGFWPGVTATLLGAAAAQSLFFAHGHGMAFLSPADLLRLLIFAFTSLLTLCAVREQQETTQRFQRSMANLNAVISNSPSVVFLKDLQGCYQVINPIPLKPLGLTPPDFIGKRDSEIFPPAVAAKHEAGDRRVLETNSPVQYEDPIPTPDGERSYLVIKFPIRDPKGRTYAIGGISTEITAIKSVERDRAILLESEKTARKLAEQAKAELERERALREQFVAALAHDLRNPLTAAKAGAELLVMRKPPSLQCGKNILASLLRMDSMIRDLLDVTRVGSGRALPIQIEPCSLSLILSHLVADLVLVHGDRFQLEVNVPTQGYWSPEGIRRIVENLAKNAVKYGNPKHRVTIRADKDHDVVRISVHNWGNPIPADQLTKIFEPFQTLMPERHGGKEGWGIGLALVRGMANAHGGEVEVESSNEKGTTFKVRLPMDSRAFQRRSEDPAGMKSIRRLA